MSGRLYLVCLVLVAAASVGCLQEEAPVPENGNEGRPTFEDMIADYGLEPVYECNMFIEIDGKMVEHKYIKRGNVFRVEWEAGMEAGEAPITIPDEEETYSGELPSDAIEGNATEYTLIANEMGMFLKMNEKLKSVLVQFEEEEDCEWLLFPSTGDEYWRFSEVRDTIGYRFELPEHLAGCIEADEGNAFSASGKVCTFSAISPPKEEGEFFGVGIEGLCANMSESGMLDCLAMYVTVGPCANLTGQELLSCMQRDIA